MNRYNVEAEFDVWAGGNQWIRLVEVTLQDQKCTHLVCVQHGGQQTLSEVEVFSSF